MSQFEMKVEKICRTCLGENQDMMQMRNQLDPESKPSITIADFLMEFSTIRIMFDDELPHTICMECAQKVQNVFNFKKLCESSDAKLRTHIKEKCSVIETKPEPTEMFNDTDLHTEIIQVDSIDVRDDLLDEYFDNDEPYASNDSENDEGDGSDHENDSDYEADENDSDSNPDSENQPNADEFQYANKAKIVGGRYQCEMCEKSLADRRTFLLHMRLHLGKNLKHCDICNRGFAKQNHLDRHKLTHSSTTTCQYCSEEFETKKQMKQHSCDELEQHKKMKKAEKMKERKNEIQLKKEKATDSTKVERHKTVVNAKSLEEEERILKTAKKTNGRIQCPICPRTLSHRKILKFHIRSHLGKNLVYCEICNRGFAKGSNLNRHMLIHLTTNSDEEARIIQNATQDDGRFNCPYCGKLFLDRQSFRLHIRVHVSKNDDELQPTGEVRSNDSPEIETKVENEDPDCDQDMKTVRNDLSRNQINKTMLNVWAQSNGPKKCVCLLCNESFTRISKLKDHMSWHMSDVRSLDGIDFSVKHEVLAKFSGFERDNPNLAYDIHKGLLENPNQLPKTYRITNEYGWELTLSDSETDSEEDLNHPKHNCGQCGQIFDRLHKLCYHMKHDHDIEQFQQFKCAFCMQNFPNSLVLQKHLQQQCDNKSKNVVCTKCYGRFHWRSSLEVHLAKYHGMDSRRITNELRSLKSFACKTCSKAFYTYLQLESHKVAHLPREKKFSCDICKKSFTRHDNLRSHMRIHVPVDEREAINKNHLCSYCGRSFSNSSNLTVHIRRHTGERPYQCEFCDARFPRTSDLQCHRRTHTGEKTCVCTVCGKGFNRSNKLVRHMRVHTGERPYKCPHCDRAFTQSNDLTLHVRRHTGDKPFLCYCGERFITNSLLQQHRRTNGHLEYVDNSLASSSNSVNNPHRKFNENDGKRTGITATLSLPTDGKFAASNHNSEQKPFDIQ